MDKRGEIREGVEEAILPQPTSKTWVNRNIAKQISKEVIDYLHSQGAVLRVKCPDCEWSQFVGEESVGMTPCHSCNSTGYLIEPLIKEGE